MFINECLEIGFYFLVPDELSDVNGHEKPSGSSTLSEGKGYMSASIYIQDQVRKSVEKCIIKITRDFHF